MEKRGGGGNHPLDRLPARVEGLSVKCLLMLPALLLISSCSSLIVPGEGEAVGGASKARQVIDRSVAASGNVWQKYRKVEVSYDGEWTGVVKRLQPDLVDGDFRKSSDEVYEPQKLLVRQEHKGPGGTKSVVRSSGDVSVVYESEEEQVVDQNIRDASALVADAYTAFLFGSSWLKANARDMVLLEAEEFDGEDCDLVQGRLKPGFGFSEEDRFIAWIGRESGWLRRFQFTIDGLASTRGADVDVRLHDHWKGGDGNVWPGRFVEWVERPVHVKAHEWRMTSLKVDGKRLR